MARNKSEVSIGVRRVGRQRRGTILLCVLLTWCSCAFGLDAARDVSQYAHSAWKIREGFLKSNINSIAQTPDGYLWLGTVTGLVRFDGVRTVPWTPPAGERLPSEDIRKLLVARDGRLWIGTSRGLASWKDGKLTRYPELDGLGVISLLEDRQGTMWAGGLSLTDTGRLCAIQAGSAHCFGEDGSLGPGVHLLYEDRRGDLWAAGPKRLWRWKPGPPRPYLIPDTRGLVEAGDGALLILTGSSIRRIIGAQEENSISTTESNFAARPLRDHDGSLWLGTLQRGLLHVHQGQMDTFGRSDGLSGDWVKAIFEDREGNVWVSTIDGLDRFCDVAVATLSTKQGLSNGVAASVLAARDGSVWLGTYDGLNRWKDGQPTIYRKRGARSVSASGQREPDGLAALGRPRAVREITDSGLPDDYVTSLFQDDQQRVWVATRGGLAYFQKGRFVPVSGFAAESWVHSFAEDGAGNLWISQTSGLLHLLQGTVVEKIPWTKFGRKEFALTLLSDPLQGALWLGFLEGGLAYFKDGQVRASFTAADGLGEGFVSGLRLDADRALWAATQGGLSRVKDGHVSTLTSRSGLPCDTVHWAMEDNDRSLWLYLACGLVRIERKELEAWVADPTRTVRVTLFDASDGVRSNPYSSGAHPIVTKTADGKLWFLPNDGVSIIDPRHLPFNKLPPPVHIEQVIADGRIYWQNLAGIASSPQRRLPPLVRDLTIDYTALSLAVPEKVRFRFKLEGQDRDWREVVNVRQVQYSNLAPGSYRFRVTACNNSGVWNEQGASLDFSIAPAYWQTRWFVALCVAAITALLWALYQLRLRQLAREFNIKLDARVGERTRIARELHDTLLQSFHGLLLRFQVAYELLPARPAEARQSLERAIDQAAQAITEGRNAVQGLRSSAVESNDLALAIRTYGEELRADQIGNAPVVLGVVVEGTPRTLHPIQRDEIYQVACEAVRNAFKHADATHIEVELRYDVRQVRLRVRDDGRGIDPQFLTGEGRAGHFGLHGMRERAKLMGGKLTVWSALESGAEVELSIPAARAYATSASTWRSWFGKKFSRESEQSEP
jgi:signal transduction histidine kinase/ligand-binding sensor domain-containing protein